MGLLTNKMTVALPGVLRPAEEQKPDHILNDLICFLQHKLVLKLPATFVGREQLARLALLLSHVCSAAATFLPSPCALRAIAFSRHWQSSLLTVP